MTWFFWNGAKLYVWIVGLWLVASCHVLCLRLMYAWVTKDEAVPLQQWFSTWGCDIQRGRKASVERRRTQGAMFRNF